MTNIIQSTNPFSLDFCAIATIATAFIIGIVGWFLYLTIQVSSRNATLEAAQQSLDKAKSDLAETRAELDAALKKVTEIDQRIASMENTVRWIPEIQQKIFRQHIENIKEPGQTDDHGVQFDKVKQ